MHVNWLFYLQAWFTVSRNKDMNTHLELGHRHKQYCLSDQEISLLQLLFSSQKCWPQLLNLLSLFPATTLSIRFIWTKLSLGWLLCFNSYKRIIIPFPIFSISQLSFLLIPEKHINYSGNAGRGFLMETLQNKPSF